MSDGAVALVPVAVIAALPVIAVVGAGAIVVGSVRLAAGAIETARLEHARNRVAVERRRRAAVRGHAERLRIPCPDTPPFAPDSIAALNAYADDLRSANDELERAYASEQAELNDLQGRLASLVGRRATLSRWTEQAGLNVDRADTLPMNGAWSAVEEATHQLGAATTAIVTMEWALRAARRQHEAQQAEAVWARLAMPSLAEITRDPQSTGERWREPLRQSLKRAVRDAVLSEQLPAEVTRAHAALESDDEATARRLVDAAAATLRERADHRRVVFSTLERLATVAAEAEATHNYTVLDRCDRLRGAFDDEAGRVDAAALRAWGNEQFFAMDRLLQDTRRARDDYAEAEATRLGTAASKSTRDKIRQVMKDMSWIEVPMQVGGAREGHLFIEPASAAAGSPQYGRMVELDHNRVQTYTVFLGEKSAADEAAHQAECDRQRKLEQERVFPRVAQLVQDELPDAPLTWVFTHREYEGVASRVLTPEQKRLATQEATKQRARDDWPGARERGVGSSRDSTTGRS